MKPRAAPGHGRGVVVIDEPGPDAGLDAALVTPRALIERFQAPTYRPPVLPSIALELHTLTQHRLCDTRQILTLLERDPMVAARILRTAQSPLYASRIPVKSLEHALGRLGLEVLSQIVLEVTMGMTLFRVRGYDEPMDRVRKHSTATAYLARAVALATGRPAELAFMCGLLHDIGVVACLLLLAQPAAGSPVASFDASWSAIEPVHAQVSGMLAGLWNLPPELRAALGHHHDGPPETSLARIVFVADALATELGLGLEAAPDPARVDAVRHQLGLTDARMPELMAYGERVVAGID